MISYFSTVLITPLIQSYQVTFVGFKMVLGQKYVLKRHFDGLPKADDFELVEEELPDLKVNDKDINAESVIPELGHLSRMDKYSFQPCTLR